MFVPCSLCLVSRLFPPCSDLSVALFASIYANSLNMYQTSEIPSADENGGPGQPAGGDGFVYERRGKPRSPRTSIRKISDSISQD